MRADQVRDQARQLREGPGGQRGPHSLVQFRHGEAAVGGGRAQDVHGGVPVGVRGPLLRRARVVPLAEKGQHQTATRRMVAWPPASSRTVSTATTPVRASTGRRAEESPAVDSAGQATAVTAATTAACAAMNASVPLVPHRRCTIEDHIPYVNSANRITAEVSQVSYHGPFSRYGTRKKRKDSPQPPVARSIACSAVSSRPDTAARASPNSAVPA